MGSDGDLFINFTTGCCYCRVFVSCSGLASEKSPTIHQAISSYISEALDHAPSVIIFDDLDSILATSSDSEGSQPSLSLMALTEFLTDIMDEYEVIVMLLMLAYHSILECDLKSIYIMNGYGFSG